MHAAYNRVNWIPACQMPDVVQRVDHAGVGTAEQDNRSGIGPQEQGLVIEQRIDLVAFRILAESFFVLLLWVAAGDLAREKEAGGYFNRVGDGVEARAPLPQRVKTTGRHTDVSHARVSSVIFGPDGTRMSIDHDFVAGDAKHVRQSAAMVIVAVAQDHCVGFADVDTELSCISEKRIGLPSVEKQASCSKIEPDGQSVLGNEPGSGRAVVDKHRDVAP